MARYVLSKDNDKIILTDTKTGKKRTLSIDDIDYVVDDNQKLRDENTIATYFRLKEEDFKPKTITKKANLVQEYKEAKKYDKSDITQTDPMLDFINKFKLTSLERRALIQMPYKETIKKFNRPEGEKNVILNDFQRVIEKIIEKGIKNTEEYIKNYLTKYNNEHPFLFDDVFLVSNYYKNTEDYKKIKKYIEDGNHIKNLEDLYTQGINVFANIQLGCLNQFFQNYKNVVDFLNKEWLAKYKLTVDIVNEKKRWYITYNLSHDEYMVNQFLAIKVYNHIFDEKLIPTKELLKIVFENGLKYFDNIEKISLLAKQISDVIKNRDLRIYNYKYQLGVNTDNKFTAISSNKFSKDGIDRKNIKIKKYAEALDQNPEDANFISIFYTFKDLVMTVLTPWPSLYAGENFAGGWTDKTLTRIDVIIDTLKGMGIGMGWSDRTLTRIDDILSQLKGMGDEIAGGWTDKTLNRIEIIMDTLKGMGNGVILTDKDIEYY